MFKALYSYKDHERHWTHIEVGYFDMKWRSYHEVYS